jgi:hypothetical protein
VGPWASIRPYRRGARPAGPLRLAAGRVDLVSGRVDQHLERLPLAVVFQVERGQVQEARVVSELA